MLSRESTSDVLIGKTFDNVADVGVDVMVGPGVGGRIEVKVSFSLNTRCMFFVSFERAMIELSDGSGILVDDSGIDGSESDWEPVRVESRFDFSNAAAYSSNNRCFFVLLGVRAF